MDPLRPYQELAIARTIQELPHHPLVVAPTRSGKTRMAGEVIKALGRRTLFLAHARGLVYQARDRFLDIGLDVGVVMAEVEGRPLAKVQVASRDTLLNRRQLVGIEVVVVDECHRAPSAGYRKLLKQYPCYRIGLTATPFRLDRKPLGDLFGSLVVAAYPDELVEQGFLVDPRVYVPAPPDLDGVKVRSGEYETDELERRVNTATVVGNIVAEWKDRCPGRRTVAFAVTVAHSKSIVERFRAAGVPAAHLDASSSDDDRKAVLADLEAGRVLVVSNVGLFGEGTDLPYLEACIDAAPTASLQRHLQRIGRVATACDGKAEAFILDCAGNHLRHPRLTERITYSLSEKAHLEKPKKSKPRVCPRCALLVGLRTRTCPSCLYEWPVQAREVRESDGRLVEFGGKRPELPPYEVQAKAWASLLAGVPWGREGLAARKFKAMFGVWPVVVDGSLVNVSNPTVYQKQQVFKKFAKEWLKKEREDRQASGYVAVRYQACMGRWPPKVWTRILEAKAVEVDAKRAVAAEPLLASASVPKNATTMRSGPVVAPTIPSGLRDGR